MDLVRLAFRGGIKGLDQQVRFLELELSYAPFPSCSSPLRELIFRLVCVYVDLASNHD